MIEKLFIGSVFVLLAGCNLIGPERDEPALARVDEEYLYLSDITSQIPRGISPRDSLSISKAIINQWVEKTAVVAKARKNVPEDQLDFEKKIEQYRNSLITYYYESQLIQQEVDTNISIREVEAYYDQNKQNFILKNDLIKLNYILVPKQFENRAEARQAFFSSKNAATIEAYCKEHELPYFLEPTWVYFEEAAMKIPFRLTQVSSIDYSETTREDDAYFYFIRVLGTRSANEAKPLSFVESQIKSILLNQRKMDFMEKMRQDIVDKGFEQNMIEVY